jgi:hypothetical protein
MKDYQARRARARRLQLAIVAGVALIVGGTWATVGLIERSFVWGFIAAITVDVVLALIATLVFWWVLHATNRA